MKWDAFPPRITDLEPMSERFEAFGLKAEGCRILFGRYPAGTAVPPHDHATDNWGVVTKGTMFITQGGQETGYRVGEWYHIPAKGEHSARTEVDTELIEMWFQAD